MDEEEKEEEEGRGGRGRRKKREEEEQERGEAKVAAGRNLRNKDYEDRQLPIQTPWLPVSGCVLWYGISSLILNFLVQKVGKIKIMPLTNVMKEFRKQQLFLTSHSGAPGQVLPSNSLPPRMGGDGFSMKTWLGRRKGTGLEVELSDVAKAATKNAQFHLNCRSTMNF